MATARFSATGQNALLEGGLKAAATKVNLHTADPLTTGASEGTTTKQAISWGTASAGTISNAASVSFASAPAATYTHVGLYNAANAYLCGAALTTSEVVTTPRTLTIAAAAIVPDISEIV